MTDIPDLNLHVSRYSNKAIADSGLAPIRFTLGHPRWKLPYTIAGQIKILAPTKAEFALSSDHDAFTAAYRGRLDTLNPADIAADIAAIIAATPGATGAVLLCYEDVRLGDLCHRSLFANWWEATTGHVVHELHDPTEPKKHTHKKKATTVAPPTLF